MDLDESVEAKPGDSVVSEEHNATINDPVLLPSARDCRLFLRGPHNDGCKRFTYKEGSQYYFCRNPGKGEEFKDTPCSDKSAHLKLRAATPHDYIPKQRSKNTGDASLNARDMFHAAAEAEMDADEMEENARDMFHAAAEAEMDAAEREARKKERKKGAFTGRSASPSRQSDQDTGAVPEREREPEEATCVYSSASITAYRCISNTELASIRSVRCMCSKYPHGVGDDSWTQAQPARDHDENGYFQHVLHGSEKSYERFRSPYLSFAQDPSQLLGGAGAIGYKSHCHPVGGESGRNLVRIVLTNYIAARNGQWVEFSENNSKVYLCEQGKTRHVCDRPVVFFAYADEREELTMDSHGAQLDQKDGRGRRSKPADAARNLRELGIVACTGMIPYLEPQQPSMTDMERAQLALTGSAEIAQGANLEKYTRGLDQQVEQGQGRNTATLLSGSVISDISITTGSGLLGTDGIITQGDRADVGSNAPVIRQFTKNSYGTYNQPLQDFIGESVTMSFESPESDEHLLRMCGNRTMLPLNLIHTQGREFLQQGSHNVCILENFRIGGVAYICYMSGHNVYLESSSSSSGEITVKGLNKRSMRDRPGLNELRLAQTYVSALNSIVTTGGAIATLKQKHDRLISEIG